MRTPELDLSPEMIRRAADFIVDHSWRGTPDEADYVAEKAIRAAFEDVPMSNYSIGTLLQGFSLVICVAPAGGAVVCETTPGDPGAFDVLGHKLTLTYGGKSNGLASVQVSGLVKARENDGAA